MRRDRCDEDDLTEARKLRKACERHLKDLRANARWPVDYVPTPRDGRGIVRRVEVASGCSSAADW